MKEIKFGVSISLSGRYSVQGRESFEGLNLWVKDTNQSGGVFIRIEKGVPLFFERPAHTGGPKARPCAAYC